MKSAVAPALVVVMTSLHTSVSEQPLSISSLSITWPSGIVQVETGIGINQRHVIVENGVPPGASLTASPVSVDFGQINEGSSSSPEAITLTNNGVDPIDVTAVTITGTDAGDFSHDFVAPVTVAGGATSTVNVTFSPMPQTAPQMLLPEGVLYRVNAGGSLVDDWEEDTDAMPASYLLAGSANIETDSPTPTLDASVPAGTPVDLFTTMRLDANQPEPFMEWDFPVAIGEEYQVRLFFVEMSRCGTSNRVFDVEIEGTVVLDNFDVYTEAGSACNVGIMREFTVIATDANLDIDFPLENGKPSVIAGFEILGSDGTSTDPRAAQMIVDHTGVNPSLNIDLSGEAVVTTGGGSVLAVDPVSIDFGQVEQGLTSAPTTVTLTNTGSASVDVTEINVTGTDAGDFSHTFVAPVTIAGGSTNTFDVTFSPAAAAGPLALPEGVLYRVNAGGALVDDWEEDSGSTASPYLLPGSTSIETDTPTPTTDASVPAGTPVDLFTTMRLDANQPDPMMEWDFPVTAGEEINVRLYFVEMSRCSIGNRVFDVEIEGTTVLEDLDIFTEAGSACNVGIMREFTVTPLDANLDINFPLENGKPSALAAIEILGSDGTSTSFRSGELEIVHTGINDTLFVSLDGEAVSSTGATLVATPATLDFGQVNEGSSSSPMTITLTNNGSEAIDVTSVSISGTDASDFSHDFTAPVTVAGASTSTFDVTFTPTPGVTEPGIFAPGDVVYRVNAGGGNITDVTDWEKDSQSGPAPYILPGCCNTESEPVPATADATVPAGTPLELFESMRLDANQPEPFMEWDFPVTANQTYEVRLFFVELSRCSVGNRVFDIAIEGTTVLSGFDIFAEVGNACNVGTMRSFIVTPTDSNLDISFPLNNGKPSALAGVEIVEAVTDTPSARTAQVNIEHTGVNGTQIVDLMGEATENPAGNPVAAFSFSVDDLEVTFTDESTDDGTIVSWDWDLGDTNSSTDQNPVHTYAAYGTYSVTLTVTDDLGNTGSVTEDVLVADPGATGPYIEVDGMVVMEAENFDSNTATSHAWLETTSEADFSGTGAMVSDPNNGTLYKKNAIASSPHMTYDIDFTNTGSYVVWMRVFAAGGGDNTIHGGLNGTPTASKMETTTFGAWTWINVNTKNAVQSLGVTAAGVNVFDIWMRHDGMIVDKIVLTTDGGFVPTGQGPAESPRSAGATTKSGFGKDMLAVDGVVDLPTEFALKNNYPNPFNPTTNIAFDLPESTDVTLEVYDMMGRRVATLISGQLNAGRYEATWNARSDSGSMVASGVYIYRLRAGNFESVKQMVLMK